MNNCNCNHNQKHAMPGPVPHNESCETRPKTISIRTVVIPATLGDDKEGSQYAPVAGTYFNTIVRYLANDAVYVYDSNGVFTLLEPAKTDIDIEAIIADLEKQLSVIVTPPTPARELETNLELDELDPTSIPNGAYVRVEHDANNGGNAALYYWDAGGSFWKFYELATPYYTRVEMDATVADIKAELEQLTEGLSKETAEREAGDTALQTAIDTLEARSDVVDVVDTHADLEGYDTANLGDNDVIKVLQDETHEGAITYYRWNKTAKTWGYVGEIGPYYTKAEMDTKLNAVNHDVENLTELMPTVLSEQKEEPEARDVYSAGYLNEALKNAGGGGGNDQWAAYTVAPDWKTIRPQFYGSSGAVELIDGGQFTYRVLVDTSQLMYDDEGYGSYYPGILVGTVIVAAKGTTRGALPYFDMDFSDIYEEYSWDKPYKAITFPTRYFSTFQYTKWPSTNVGSIRTGNVGGQDYQPTGWQYPLGRDITGPDGTYDGSYMYYTCYEPNLVWPLRLWTSYMGM